MKKNIFSIIICMMMISGLAVKAQNLSDNLKDSPLVGLWILERSLVDNNGNKITVYPGNFMKIDLDGSFTFFLHTPQGGFIVNEGKITLESDEIYVEKISCCRIMEYSCHPGF